MMPFLLQFDASAPIVVKTNASNYSISAVLCHPHPYTQQLHLVAYYSQFLQEPELNYSVYDKKLLPIVESAKLWRHYFLSSSHSVLFESDHNNLTYYLSLRKLSQRHHRWYHQLSKFDITIRHVPGKENRMADVLSRPPMTSLLPHSDERALLQSNDNSSISLCVVTLSSPSFADQLKQYEASHPLTYPPNSIESRGLHYWKERLHISDPALRQTILSTLHTHPCAGGILVLVKLIFILPKISSGPLFKTTFPLSSLLAPIVKFINPQLLLLQVFSILFLLILFLGRKYLSISFLVYLFPTSLIASLS
jgi:hypothetical protein